MDLFSERVMLNGKRKFMHPREEGKVLITIFNGSNQLLKLAMISAIIIDDEKPASESLFKLCNQKFQNKIRIQECVPSVKEGADAIRKHQPDLVFLDVEMPGENGFSLFNYFDNFRFAVVFITAYEKYAIQAIKCSALDYILKPVDEVSLADVIARYERNKLNQANNERFKLLLENYSLGTNQPVKVALPTSNGCRILNISQITCCTADDNYTNIETYSGEKLLVSKTLKAIEELLPEELFFRIHKSTLVNINYIRNYSNRNENSITLETGQKFDVAVRRKDDLEKLIATRFGKMH